MAVPVAGIVASSTSPSAPTLGDWLRATRAGQGVSQRALADRAGLSRSYLCELELGRGARPSVAIMDKLAAALGASRTDLLRAAGLLEQAPPTREHEAEGRLLAVFRDLGPEGRLLVERFARFVHHDEHRWIQPALLADADRGDAPVAPYQAGPTLFDLEPPIAFRRDLRPNAGEE